MGTIKKFWKYLLIFLVIYLLIDFLTFMAMKENYKDLNNYVIKTESPKITVTESRATYSHGYIKGSITNNTGEHIEQKYLQIDLYDSAGMYLGYETKEIKYFNLEETINYDVNYSYNNVGKIEISMVDEVKEKEKSNVQKQVEIWWPVVGIISLIYLLP